MKANTELISTVNSYATNNPLYIVIHNTDNENAGAGARTHAKAQHDGNFKGYSAHDYVDDECWYQAMPHDHGAWHVGVNYGGKLFGTVNNRNSIGVEMCMQKGFDYDKAFLNLVEAVKQLMKQYNIPVDRVVTHFDVCGKNCPSQIRLYNDVTRFKNLISGVSVDAKEIAEEKIVDKYYRVRKSWIDSKSQIGAYTKLENAKAAADKNPDYAVYDWNGNVVYISRNFLQYGDTGEEVGKLQFRLNYIGYHCEVDEDFGTMTENALKKFQQENGLEPDKKYGEKSKEVLENLFRIIKAYKTRVPS